MLKNFFVSCNLFCFYNERYVACIGPLRVPYVILHLWSTLCHHNNNEEPKNQLVQVEHGITPQFSRYS